MFAGLAVMTLAPPAAFSQSRDGVRRLGVLLSGGRIINTCHGLLQGLADSLSVRAEFAHRLALCRGDPALFERYAADSSHLAPR